MDPLHAVVVTLAVGFVVGRLMRIGERIDDIRIRLRAAEFRIDNLQAFVDSASPCPGTDGLR